MNKTFDKCRECKEEFVTSEGDLSLYKKVGLPPPKECFRCRMQKLFAFWIFGKFRKGKSDLSGKSIITILPENPDYPIYDSREWHSDEWDPMKYGADYHEDRPFFEQLKGLQTMVPRPHQTGNNNTDCDWCDDVWDSKNCYLSRALLKSENVSYSYRVFNCKDSFNLVYCYDTDKSFDATFCFKCFEVRYCFNSRDCIESAFLYDCRNVQNSFMCWNLRNKQYCILNKQFTKKEYEEKLEKYNMGSRKVVADLKKQFNEIVRENAIHRANFNVRADNSTGNYLTNCNRCENCFYWEDSEDCRNCMRGLKSKNCIDMAGSGEGELCGYGSMIFPGGYKTRLSVWTQNCNESDYLDLCIDCEECFGCVGLKKKKFCVLNKQYSEDDYRALRARIMINMEKEGGYGTFFPYASAPGGYSISTSQIYFPKTKEEILSMDAIWGEVKDISSDGISPTELPDDIQEVDESITKQPINCPETGYRFNVAPHELSFYKALNIPLPLFHPDHNVIEQFKLLGMATSTEVVCVFCQKKTEAYYLSELDYKKIACVECYQKNVA